MLIETILTSKNKISSAKFRILKTSNSWDEVLTYTSSLSCISDLERLYCFENQITERPKCKCGKELVFTSTYHTAYLNTCSVKCAASEEDNLAKRKKTKLERYGSAGFNNLEKRKQTNLEKYGVDYGFQAEVVKDKIKSTLILEYGVDNISKAEFIKDKKRENTDQVAKGVTVSLNRQRKRLKNPSYILLMNKEWLEAQYEKMTITQIADYLNELYGTNISFSTVAIYLDKHGIARDKWMWKSGLEQEIADFIISYDIQVLQNDRTTISPKEIDVYVPSYNIGIELDGLYHHSLIDVESDSKNIYYHLNKTNKCEEKGIQLLHITDYEWQMHNNICKSLILSKLGKNERIYARKTMVKSIDARMGNAFIEMTHMQGSCSGGTFRGLFLEDELVAVMQIGKSRFDKSVDYELLRYCSKLYTNIVGGFSKLLKSFNLTGTLLSYANRRWSNGNVYEKNGFTQVRKTVPNYSYVDRNKGTFESRLKYQKHKLSGLLENFDPDLTESENMFNHGFSKYYDCGSIVYMKNI